MHPRWRRRAQRGATSAHHIEPGRQMVDRPQEAGELRITTPDACGFSCGWKVSRHAVRECLGDVRRLDDIGARKHRDRASGPATRARPLPEERADGRLRPTAPRRPLVRRGPDAATLTFENASAYVSRTFGRRARRARPPRPSHRDRGERSDREAARDSFSRYVVSGSIVHATRLRDLPRAHGTCRRATRRSEPGRARDHRRERQPLVLQWLPQDSRRNAGTGQFVQEQHAPMSERHLSPAAVGSSTTIAGADHMVGAERRSSSSARPGGRRPTTEWSPCLNASARVERRKDPGQPAPRMVFPVPGGPISGTLWSRWPRSRAAAGRS